MKISLNKVQTFSIICVISILLVLMVSCTYKLNDTPTLAEKLHTANVDILKDTLIKFRAKGGAYIIMNTTKDKVIDQHFIQMPEDFSIWSYNVLRLFNYAVGMNKGIIKEDEKIVFNNNERTLFDRIPKLEKESYLTPYVISDYSYPLRLLQAYVRLFKNKDKYLTKSELAVLQKAVSENVKTGVARAANIDGFNVSGLTSTTESKEDSNEVYTLFIGQFQIKRQNYAIITILDEPQKIKATFNFNSSGWNSVPFAASLMRSLAEIDPKGRI